MQEAERTERHPILARAPWVTLTVQDMTRAQEYARLVKGRREDRDRDVLDRLAWVAYGRSVGKEPKWLVAWPANACEDFPAIGVRARGVSGDALYPPQLLVRPHELHDYPSTVFFVLVAVDMDALKAAPLGWARRSEVIRAPVRDDITEPAHAVKATWLHALPAPAADSPEQAAEEAHSS
jgi:hypothetical protein